MAYNQKAPAMRTLLENLKEDERAPDLRTIKCAGRFIVNDIGQAIAEIERLNGLLADKEYIRTLADYQRGHLSYAGQLEARERRSINRTK